VTGEADPAAPKRAAVVPWIASSLLAFAAVVLWLNLKEPDLYDHALPGEPAGPVNQETPKWLPEGVELSENLLKVRVEDGDGWYRLFWAGSETYWFDDAAYFAGALVNRYSRMVEGRWTLKGTLGGKPFALTYELRETAAPEGAVDVGPVTAPAGVHWCARKYRTRLRSFAWVLK
jgi:hypothetical protein